MAVDEEVISSLRERLGPVGIWLGPLATLPMGEEQGAVRRLEELGYGSIWAGEILSGKEAFAHIGALLAATSRTVAGTGIANLWARHPASMQGGAATLGSAWPGRFVLGIGVSHARIVDASGQHYERPLEQMARYLDRMDAAAPAAPAPAVAVPRLLAALGPRMLALAGERADGAHSYFVPPTHTPGAREALGPGRLLVPEQAVVLATDATEARAVARQHTERYLQLPNYVNNLLRLGYSEDDVAGTGSDRLLDGIVAWGSEEAIAQRVREHLDGGADHVLVQALGSPPDALHALERLAPALLH